MSEICSAQGLSIVSRCGTFTGMGIIGALHAEFQKKDKCASVEGKKWSEMLFISFAHRLQ